MSADQATSVDAAAPSGGPDGIERRSHARQRVFKGGMISQAGTIECTVRNLSACGAGIDVPAQTSIPETFLLEILSGPSLHRCRKVWQVGNRIGVEFGI